MIIDFIKAWFLSDNNNFSFLFKEESQEKLYNSIPADEALKTRQMYFDLAALL